MSKEKHKLTILVWAIFLVGFYLAAGYLSSSKLYDDKVETKQRHQARLDPNLTEQGLTQVNPDQLNGLDTSAVETVKVGIYVDRIIEISTKAIDWTVDFYIWFKWYDEHLKPGESFQIIDGEVLDIGIIDESVVEGEHYALYRVTASITKFFNIVRYPLDNHLLTIQVEDREHQWNRLRYIVDDNAAQYSSRVVAPGYKLGEPVILQKPHAYKTARGAPGVSEDSQAIYSQIIYAIPINRPDWGLYFKMFQGLFAALAIAFLAFIFGPLSGERIALGVGAFFAAVANSYINLSELPGVGFVTLTDMANGIGMVTIFLTLLGSIISQRIANTPNGLNLAHRFDQITLWLFIIGFTSVSATMAMMASN